MINYNNLLSLHTIYFFNLSFFLNPINFRTLKQTPKLNYLDSNQSQSKLKLDNPLCYYYHQNSYYWAHMFQNKYLTQSKNNIFLIAFKNLQEIQLKYWYPQVFCIHFKLTNKDLRLLNRELTVFLAKFFNPFFLFKKLKFFLNRKLFSVLRSPFVYNKSHEQFQLNIFKIYWKSEFHWNLFFYNYYIKQNFFLFKYSLLLIKREITW